MANSEGIKLNKIRVYKKDKGEASTPDNITIEVDGKELLGIFSFQYEVAPGNFPLVTLKMVADTDIDTEAVTKKEVQQEEADASF